MRQLIWLVYVLLMVATTQAATQYRDFTSAEGKPIRGCIRAYDAKKKMVTIERDNKLAATVPITAFCEADQSYVLEWDAAKRFLSNRHLVISCDKERVDQRKEKIYKELRLTGGGTSKSLLNEIYFKNILYKVELNNRHESALKDLRMEYIVYYEQSETSWEKPVVEQKFLKGEEPIPLIEGRKKMLISTNPVEIYSDNVSRKSWSSGERRTGGEGEIHGFRARLYMKMPSGKEVMREFSSPDALSKEKFPWKD